MTDDPSPPPRPSEDADSLGDLVRRSLVEMADLEDIQERMHRICQKYSGVENAVSNSASHPQDERQSA